MQEIYHAPDSVAAAPEATRAEFIKKTYFHLAGAILAFIGIEALLFSIPGIENTVMGLLGMHKFSWLAVMGSYIAISWIAESMAHRSTSLPVQYAALAIYVLATSAIFLPLLLMANKIAGGGVIYSAAAVTGALFIALSVVAFTSKKDFSFLGGILKVGGLIALGVIALSIFTGGFSLGILFSGVMVLFAGGSILYSTSNVMYHYHPQQHVAASLSLFAGVALMFWYILRIFMSFGRD